MESSTNGIARHLLDANEERLTELAPAMITVISGELGLPPLEPEHQWPADVVAATREFLVCVAGDDEERILARGGVFEAVGLECARGGIEFEVLEASLRMAVRLTQAQTHRAVLTDPQAFDADAVLQLMSRVLTCGEAVVRAARRGFDMVGLSGDDGEELGRRLASELLSRGQRVHDLAARLGWDPEGLVCAVLTTPSAGGRIARTTGARVAYFSRSHDVVLGVPLRVDTLATTLRPILAEVDCVVGPAVPITEFPDSLALCQRLLSMPSGTSGGADFVDDSLLQLVCSADSMAVRALRRKHFADLDQLPEDQREVLADTLHQWLRQWGHRPSISATLAVHPQTVSGRVHRLKDLLADDLDDPTTRSEMLVLLTAEGVV